MLRLVFVLVFFATNSFAQDNGRPTESDYDMAESIGHDKPSIEKESLLARKKFNTESFVKKMSPAFIDRDAFAQKTDSAIEAMIGNTAKVLRKFKHHDYADKILIEYKTHYKTAVFCSVSYCTKEIGDYEPLWVWLENVHNTVEEKIGEDWCKFFHAHDMYIFNHAVPVVFDPASYPEDEYLDHFAGHPLSKFKWEHHGLAGVVSYWSAYTVCAVGTYGIGPIAFACTPICEVVERVVDKKIAPPIARNIWRDAQQ